MANVNQHHKKTRAIAVAALVAGVLGLGVAFAALSTQLLINGDATIGQAGWDIHWAAAPTCTKTGEASFGTPTVTNSNHTITIDPAFVAPADTVTCTFDALNTGDLDATFDATAFTSTINVSGLTSNNIGYTLTYRSNSGGATSGAAVGSLTSLDLVKSTGKHEMQIVFTNNNSDVLGAEATGSFSFSLPYKQKNI
ncbi:MAG: hypothetical protein LBK50_03210 [Candidatus Nomurabacteria bacterium]|jgi:hypothetical protein|nr:hypothetical protein [Candidatus Nomurabacteria bacterium]